MAGFRLDGSSFDRKSAALRCFLCHDVSADHLLGIKPKGGYYATNPKP